MNLLTKMLPNTQLAVWEHRGKSAIENKNNCPKVCEIVGKVLTLHRYPENNLFTLKELIPIEDKAAGCEARRFSFCPLGIIGRSESKKIFG